MRYLSFNGDWGWSVSVALYPAWRQMALEEPEASHAVRALWAVTRTLLKPSVRRVERVGLKHRGVADEGMVPRGVDARGHGVAGLELREYKIVIARGFVA